jgi:thiol-disulfide isomerase/thioredoxin
MVSLSDFLGKKTLLLFWNPSCGFCQQMLADLKAWEAEPPQGAPTLLVVSTGSVEVNQALGLRSPVLLDERSTVGPRFGVHGTPIAVLVDAESKIASGIAAGAPDVFALARSGKNPAKPATS